MANATSDISSTIEFKVEGLAAIKDAEAAVKQLSTGVTSMASAVSSLSTQLKTLQGVADAIKMPSVAVGTATPTVQQPTVDNSSTARLAVELDSAVDQAQRMVRELDATGQEAETIYEMLQAAQLAITSTVEEARQLSGQLEAASANAKEVASAIRGVGDTDVVFDLDSNTVEEVKELSTEISEVQSKLAQGGDAKLLDSNETQAAATQLDNVSNKLHEVQDAKQGIGTTKMDLGDVDGARADVEQLTSAYRELKDTTSQGVGAVKSGDLDKASADAEKYSGELKEIKVQQDRLSNWDTDMAQELREASVAATDLYQDLQTLNSAKAGSATVTGSGTGMNETATATRDATRATEQFTEAQKKSENATQRSADSLANQRYALYDVAEVLRTIGYVSTAWTVATVGAAISFESSFADVIRTVGVTGDAARELRHEFETLSQEIPQSFGDLSEIASLGGQLGIEKDGIEDFTEVVAKLGSTTDLTTESASFMLGRFQTILGTAPADFERLASSVLEVGISSAATESEIAKMAIEIAAFSSQAGLAEQDIIALTATLASGGVPAERARSTIQEAFGKMDQAIRDNGEELDKWAALSGVSAEEFAASWGTENFMNVFVKSIEGIRDAGEDGSAVLAELGITSQRAVPTLLTLASSTELLHQSMNLANAGWSEGTALTDQYGIIAETAAAKLTRMKNSFVALFSAIGEGVITHPVFSKIIELLTNTAGAARALIENVPLAKFFLAVATAGLIYIGTIASLRATTALATAATFALEDSQKAMQTSLGATASAVTRLVKNLLLTGNVVDKDTAATNTNTAAKNANATARSRAISALAAESAAMRASIGATSAGTVATSALTKSKQAASTAGTVLAAKMNQTAIGAKTLSGAVSFATGAMGFLRKAISAVVGVIPSLLIPTAVIASISWMVNKFTESQEKANQAREAVSNLAQAVQADTAAYQNGAAGVYELYVAYDQLGNMARSSMYLIEENTSTADMQAEALSNLNDSVYNSGAGFSTYIGAQEGLKSATDEATEAIQYQQLVLGENALQGYQDIFKTEPVRNFINTLRELEEAGKIPPGTAQQFIQDFVDGKVSAEDAQKAFLDLQTVMAHFSEYELWSSGGSIPDFVDPNGTLVETFDRFKESMDLSGVETYEDLVEISSGYQGLMSVLDELERNGLDVSAILDEDAYEAFVDAASGMDIFRISAEDAEGAVLDLDNSLFDSFGSVMGMADAMYALGGALFENGLIFDVFSEAGRNNLSAIDAAMDAAVINANGNSTALAQNVGSIIQALIALGVEGNNAISIAMSSLARARAGDTSIPMLNMNDIMNTSLTTLGNTAQGFGRSFQEGYNDAVSRASSSSRKGKDGIDSVADAAKKARKEIRTLSDYVSDLSKVMSRAFEFRWGQQESLDDTAEAWEKLHDWAKDAAEQIDDAKKSIDDAQKSIRDAKNELKDLEAQLLGLKSDEKILEYQLRVAVDYGDTLRAGEIRAELAKNRADQGDVKGKQTDAKSDVDTGNKDLADATKELSQAQKDAQKDLSGTSASAREQRDMVWSLLKSYQSQIEAYAETGASTQELERYTKQLQGEFENQLRQLGYNQTEVKKYSGTFTDLTTVINNVPRNITVSVDANPAQRALGEFRAQLSRTDSSINNTRNQASKLNSALGGVGSTVKDDLTYSIKELEEMLRKAREEAERMGEVLRTTNVGGSLLFHTPMSVGGLVGGPIMPNHPAAVGTDTVPTILTPGEFVLKRSAVQALGVPFLNALNNNRGAVPATNSTYVHMSNPEVQLMEMMPHQFNALVTAVSNNVQRAMVSGADLSVASSRANQRAVKAGAN